MSGTRRGCEDVALSLTRSRSALASLGADLPVGAGPTVWQGSAASAAYLREEALARAELALVTAVATVQRAVGEAAERVRSVQAALSGVERAAAAHRLRVDDDGAVRDTSCLPTPPDPALAAAARRDRERARQAAQAAVREVLRSAGDIDDDLAAVLRARGDGRRRQRWRHVPRPGLAGGRRPHHHHHPGTPGGWTVRRRDVVAGADRRAAQLGGRHDAGDAGRPGRTPRRGA